MSRTVADLLFEHSHRRVGMGAARAAVFGVSDGLLTNIALILGVAGAHPAPGVVRLAGLAGLVGGAFSMAAGEYVSMRAQTELLQREIALEREALASDPDFERAELTDLYKRRGVDPGTARSMVEQVHADPEVALEVHAREEIGVDPQSLGSPPAAAAASFASFGLGALMPLFPWLFAHGNGAVVASILLAALSSVAVGAALARFTERPWLLSAARQLLIGAATAGLTYGIGTLVGVGATSPT